MIFIFLIDKLVNINYIFKTSQIDKLEGGGLSHFRYLFRVFQIDFLLISKNKNGCPKETIRKTMYEKSIKTG